jgi:hypothetical protein
MTIRGVKFARYVRFGTRSTSPSMNERPRGLAASWPALPAAVLGLRPGVDDEEFGGGWFGDGLAYGGGVTRDPGVVTSLRP